MVAHIQESKLNQLFLSTAYLPPISWWAYLLHYSDAYIETNENYSKQSYRNRCMIYTASGPLPLIIPVKHFGQNKINIRDVEIDYKSNWRQIHLKTIHSAYSNAPYFIYYIDNLSNLFENPPEHLYEFNAMLIKSICTSLTIEAPKPTSHFQKEIINSIDLRFSLHPKKKDLCSINFPVYYQIFSEKHGFKANLSILDLLFHLGPDARRYLESTLSFP